MKFIYISMTQRAIGLLAGLSLIIAGVIVETKSTTYLALIMSSAEFNPVSISLNIIGALIFIVGFFGCCSANKVSFYFVAIFSSLLSLLLVTEIVVLITAYVFQEQVLQYVEALWLSTLHDYTQSTQLINAWDYIQQKLSCCGVTNYTNWATVDLPLALQLNNVNGTNVVARLKSVPDSCCPGQLFHPGCGFNALDDVTMSKPQLSINTQGCATSVIDWVEDNSVLIAVFMAYLTGVQLIGIVLTSTLAKNIYQECYGHSAYSSRLARLKATIL